MLVETDQHRPSRHPNGLWSLWDMLDHSAAKWFDIAARLAALHSISILNSDLPVDFRATSDLIELASNCDAMGLKVSVGVINDASEQFKIVEGKPPPLYGELDHRIAAIKTVIESELATFLFFVVRAEHQKYYEDRLPFGTVVPERI